MSNSSGEIYRGSSKNKHSKKELEMGGNRGKTGLELGLVSNYGSDEGLEEEGAIVVNAD